jgi:hypothetical protein
VASSWPETPIYARRMHTPRGGLYELGEDTSGGKRTGIDRVDRWCGGSKVWEDMEIDGGSSFMDRVLHCDGQGLSLFPTIVVVKGGGGSRGTGVGRWIEEGLLLLNPETILLALFPEYIVGARHR